MRRKSYCTRQRRIILTNWESKSSPLSNLSERNTPIFWNKNGKPILPISRPKMIWKNFIMFGLMWNIYWRFLPRHNRSAAQKNLVNKVVCFSFSAFQRNAQPLPPAMISGVWGYVTNKHLAGIPGTGFLLNTQSYVRLHCLPVVLRVFGRESVYSCRIDKPLITAYNRVIILNCYNREMQKNKIFCPL